jgi:hypothetical protein
MAVALLLLAPVQSAAEGVLYSYTEFARHIWLTSQEIAKARGLDERDADTVQRLSAAWVYGGPCEMRFHIAESRKPSPALQSSTSDAISAVISSQPKSNFHAAVSQTIMVMLKENLGRRPPDQVCRYAMETAEYREPLTPKR